MNGIRHLRAAAGRVRRRTLHYAPLAAGARRSLGAAPRSAAISFDDGPDADFTPAVLDILSEHGVKATFFVVGRRAERHPEIVRRIVAEGHALGSHTATHPDLWKLDPWVAIAEFRRGRGIVEDITGAPVRLFRPPKGWLDVAQAAGLRALGFRTWLWTVDPEDWAPGATPESILRGVEGIGPGDVVLLHDAIEDPIDASALNRQATVAALPGIIDEARSRDLALVTLS